MIQFILNYLKYFIYIVKLQYKKIVWFPGLLENIYRLE